jgi:hypothetical protein
MALAWLKSKSLECQVTSLGKSLGKVSFGATPVSFLKEERTMPRKLNKPSLKNDSVLEQEQPAAPRFTDPATGYGEDLREDLNCAGADSRLTGQSLSQATNQISSKQINTGVKMKKPMSYVPWLLGAVGAGYLAYRYFESQRLHLDSEVARRLPVSKDLKTIPDDHGNYDIDGVSFDTEGTIVSGDNTKAVVAPI